MKPLLEKGDPLSELPCVLVPDALAGELELELELELVEATPPLPAEDELDAGADEFPLVWVSFVPGEVLAAVVFRLLMLVYAPLVFSYWYWLAGL